MNRWHFALAPLLVGFGMIMPSAHADGILKKLHLGKPQCEPGFQIVEEIVMQDVTRTICKMVPETKKKWVYSVIDDPFCVQNSKHGQCPQCSGPYCRKLLVKKQIDEPCPTMKCVTETIVERLPVKVYRKVPIATSDKDKK
ncbi:MAG: hypothetical protein FJ303_23430 [Planctomycetes bacterium]|nr:hypothetical protein [Planctomycetota bacterium]